MSRRDTSGDEHRGLAVAGQRPVEGPPVRSHFRHGPAIALGLLIAIASLVNLLWIGHDTRSQPRPDPNHYLIKTFEFVNSLDGQEDVRFWAFI